MGARTAASPGRYALHCVTLLAQGNVIGGGGGRWCRTWLCPPAAAAREWLPQGPEEGAPRLLLQGLGEGADTSTSRETAHEDGDLHTRYFSFGSGLALGWAWTGRAQAGHSHFFN